MVFAQQSPRPCQSLPLSLESLPVTTVNGAPDFGSARHVLSYKLKRELAANPHRVSAARCRVSSGIFTSTANVSKERLSRRGAKWSKACSQSLIGHGLTGIGGSGYSCTDARSALISRSSATEPALLRQRQMANPTNKRSRTTKIATYVSPPMPKP
jgi:hypothetical protein